ncbi:hypothetical protein SEA_GAUGELDP_39 [Mycobacterium phage GaugeLDP]|nr:hypothetical protein SEA_GAUGELDP_39 [Mycobacterium phage GaugeLDP]
MSNPILVIDEDYTVTFHGRKWALSEPPMLEQDYRSFWPSLRVSFGIREIPPPPPPKPKRTWATAMGLRKPYANGREHG